MELQLTVTFFDAREEDKIFKIEINSARKEATILCPTCFTELTKQNNRACENCKYKITDKLFENTESIL